MRALEPCPADTDRYVLERKRRTASKRKRNRELRERASSDLRRLKTFSRLWVAYVRLARDPGDRERPITAAELCDRAGVSEAAFHKNFSGRNDAATSGIEVLMLAMVDRIADNVIREVRREVGSREEAGEAVTQYERVTIAIGRLVAHTMRYPQLFNVDGILPREVIYSLSDALADAMIWNGPATLEERANAVAMAKYHTTALIGIMRSGLGEDIERDKLVARIIYVMVSQIIAALVAEHDPVVEVAATRVIDWPIELDVANSRGYKRIEDSIDRGRVAAAVRVRHSEAQQR